jgi:hypothetical protein
VTIEERNAKARHIFRCFDGAVHWTTALLAERGGNGVRRATFTRDVAPILYGNCAGCHRPGEIAPMSLLDYKSVRPWAKSIRQAALVGKMPPWFADAKSGAFANDPRLSRRRSVAHHLHSLGLAWRGNSLTMRFGLSQQWVRQ